MLNLFSQKAYLVYKPLFTLVRQARTAANHYFCSDVPNKGWHILRICRFHGSPFVRVFTFVTDDGHLATLVPSSIPSPENVRIFRTVLCHDKKLHKPQCISHNHVYLYQFVRSFTEWVESHSGFIFLTFSSLYGNSVLTHKYSCSDTSWIGPEAQKLSISKSWNILEISTFGNASCFEITSNSLPFDISSRFLAQWFHSCPFWIDKILLIS